MTARRIAVVGAGPAGLAAAAHLGGLGADATLFEATSRLGGQLRSVRRDGWLAEAGPLLVAEPAAEVRSLLDRVGLAPRTIRASAAARRRYVVHRGVPQPIPATLGDLIASPLLSLAGRLRMAREPFVAVREGGEDESVESFARRRFGDEVAERLFDSLVAEVSAGDASQTLMRYLFPKLIEFEQGAGSVLKGQVRAGMEMRRRLRGKPQGAWSCSSGLGEVVDALARAPGVGCSLDAQVTAVEPGPDAVTVVIGGERQTFDAVVIAASAPDVGRITFPSAMQPDAKLIGEIPCASVVTISLGYRRDAVSHPLDGLGIRVPSAEGRPLLTILVPSTVFPDRAPAGHVLVTAIVGGVRHPELLKCSDTELVELVRNQLAELIGATGEPVLVQVDRWPDSIPQGVAGHGERLAAAERIEANAPRLVFAGSWRDGVSVSDILRSGVRAADRLVARLEAK